MSDDDGRYSIRGRRERAPDSGEVDVGGRPRPKHPPLPPGVADWLRTCLAIATFLGTMIAVYVQVDRRLTSIETKLELAPDLYAEITRLNDRIRDLELQIARARILP